MKFLAVSIFVWDKINKIKKFGGFYHHLIELLTETKLFLVLNPF